MISNATSALLTDSRAIRRCGITLTALCIAAGPLADRVTAQAPPAGKWLVDHGRALGLDISRPTRDDAERVLVWMEAAARVNPDLAEAYLWQYDILNRLSRTDAALAALASYCKLNPDDVSAQLDLIAWTIERGQSVDARLAFCAEQLKAAPLSPLVRSDLHRRMAELFLRSGDPTQAEAHAARAVEAFPGNVAALSLLVEVADGPDRPARRVRMLLAMIAAAPEPSADMWRLARRLDELSLHTDAAGWYERALSALRRGQPDGAVPVDFLIDFATCYLDDGKYEQAAEMARRTLDVAPDAVAGRFLLIDVALKTGGAHAVDQYLSELNERFGGVDPASVEQAGLTNVCHAAWYYLRYAPDAARAVAFATRARDLAPEIPDVQVVYGLAKLAAGETEEAAAVLRAWSGTHQWASAGLGEALLARGQTAEALKVLRAGEALRRSGRAYERIVAALATQQQEPAPVPRPASVIEALRRFDERVLSFGRQPANGLRLEVSVPRDEWDYGDPWLCELRLTNVSPIPISIGEQHMVAGRVLVSLKWGDNRSEQLSNYLPLSLAWKPVLAASESVTLTQSLDVGPAAALARSMPQRELDLSISILLDPVAERPGRWVSALPGFPSVGVQAKRRAIDASRVGVARLADLLSNGAEADRIKAARSIAGLIAEREAAQKTAPDYVLRRVDELKLRRLLLSALADPTPVVRAAVLDAMRTVAHSPRTLEQLAPLLSGPNWLVRLVAVDMLAQTQGESFRPVLTRMSSSDPADLVRRLADLRLKQLPPASGQ